MIDLRSDTMTRPTPAMRRAMADAEVGDAVYGEDPTVNTLQERVAELFGRDAALFCPTGTMCNQIWLQVLAPRGTEVLVEADSHVVNFEAASAAILGGMQFRTVTGRRGLLASDAVQQSLRPAGSGAVATSVICIEHPHNRGGGHYYPVEHLKSLRAVADGAGVAVYMDGARVWNAAVASGEELATYGDLVDGLMCCLSKGIGAPAGSLLVGDAAAIAEAAVWRQRYGGAMRQAGVLAAAGLVGLGDRERLAEDHAHARRIGTAAADARPGVVEPDDVVTNMVFLSDLDAPTVSDALRAEGVLVGAVDVRTLRLVTHRDVSAADANRAADAVARVLAAA